MLYYKIHPSDLGSTFAKTFYAALCTAGSSDTPHAGMMKLVDMRDLGSRASALGFESPCPHQRETPPCWVVFLFGMPSICCADRPPAAALFKIRKIPDVLPTSMSSLAGNGTDPIFSSTQAATGYTRKLPVFDNAKQQDVPSEQADILLLAYSETAFFRNADTVSDTVIL